MNGKGTGTSITRDRADLRNLRRGGEGVDPEVCDREVVTTHGGRPRAPRAGSSPEPSSSDSSRTSKRFRVETGGRTGDDRVLLVQRIHGRAGIGGGAGGEGTRIAGSSTNMSSSQSDCTRSLFSFSCCRRRLENACRRVAENWTNTVSGAKEIDRGRRLISGRVVGHERQRVEDRWSAAEAWLLTVHTTNKSPTPATSCSPFP